jgi:acetyl esterase
MKGWKSIYPSTVIRSERPSRKEFGEGYFLDRATLEWFYTRYLGESGSDDWRLSPLLAESFINLPPMLLITAECDPLTDDCLAFAARVEAEGGVLARWQADGVVHGFITLGKLFPEAEEAITVAARALRRAFEVSLGS